MTPRATAVQATKVFKGPVASGQPEHVTVWVGYHPACGCAWGWCLDRHALNPDLDGPRLRRAADAEEELAHSAHHHVTRGVFHVGHRQ